MGSVSFPVIAELRVRSVRVPMREPHRTAGGVVAESPLVLTDLVTDGGIVGRSMVFTYTPAALGPTAAMVRNLAPLVVGEELAPVELERKLSARFRLLGAQGLVGMALAAIDMAAWDALARLHEVSLVRLLGGLPKPIRCYAPVGFDGPAESARDAARWTEKGFRGVKAKIGHDSVREDVAVIRAIRKAVGDDAEILVDYNQCLSPAEALERLRILDGEGVGWVEEPTLAHDFSGHALIARASRIPIQAGENWWSPLEFRSAVEAHATDLLMPDVMKVGGVTAWTRVAALAQAHALPVSSHLWPELSARLLSVTPTAHRLEYIDFWNPILAAPLRVEEGLAIVDDSPGSGLEWNEEEVARFAAP